MHPFTLRSNRGRRSLRRVAVAAGAVALSASLAVVAGSTDVMATTTPTLQSVNVTNFSGVLANKSGHTLYLLTAETNAKLHCKTSCLSVWIPVEVTTKTKSVMLGAHVKGKIGFVTRTKTMKQVTFNGYPVYSYVGDKAAGTSNGEAVVADGGTWLMVSAAATKAATSAVEPLVQSANEPSYPSVLVNSHSDSLYLLSTEVGGTLMCTGGCTAVWLPLIVSSTTTSVAHLANVKGTIGFVARSKTTDQVTVNSYPVYTYVGDSGPGSVNGEGVVAYGGTWYLLNAGATKSSTTPVTPVTSGPGWSRRP